MLSDHHEIRKKIDPERYGIRMEKHTITEIELEDEIILKLAMQAHEQDITLNQHINNVLRVKLEKVQQENPQLLNE